LDLFKKKETAGVIVESSHQLIPPFLFILLTKSDLYTEPKCNLIELLSTIIN